jgi:hypothetical protein
MMIQFNTAMDQRLQATQSEQVFDRNALSQICPGCCYRPARTSSDGEDAATSGGTDSDQILISATDGNFQHRRLKMARLKGRDYNLLSTPMFIRDIKGVYQPDWDLYKGGLTGCGTASNKPTTFQQYEETGLLGISCR